MGATGAGKTTALDVLAGRKTAGWVRGDIRLNGLPATTALLARLTAYAEQEDAH
jgi:ABC-type multidrug transport system ATPase subunit